MAQSAETIEFRRTRDFSSLFSTTSDFLVQNISVGGRAFLIYVGPFILVAGVLSSFYQADLFSGIFAAIYNPAALDAFDDAAVLSLGLYVIAMLVAVVASMVTMVLFYALIVVYREYGPGNFDLPEILAVMKRIFWPLVLLSFLIGLVFVGLVLVNIVPCLGQIAFLVGTVYLMTCFALAPMALLNEGGGYIDTLKRVVELVKGHWWRTFGLMAVAWIVMIVLQTALTIPSYGAMFLIGFLTAGEGGIIYRIVSILAATLEQVGVFFYGIVVVAAALQYFNLVERKEAPALMERIDQLAHEGEGPIGYPEE